MRQSRHGMGSGEDMFSGCKPDVPYVRWTRVRAYSRGVSLKPFQSSMGSGEDMFSGCKPDVPYVR